MDTNIPLGLSQKQACKKWNERENNKKGTLNPKFILAAPIHGIDVQDPSKQTNTILPPSKSYMFYELNLLILKAST